MKTKPSNIAPFKVTHFGDAVGGLVMGPRDSFEGRYFFALMRGKGGGIMEDIDLSTMEEDEIIMFFAEDEAAKSEDGKVEWMGKRRTPKELENFLRLSTVMLEAEDNGLDSLPMLKDALEVADGKGQMKPREAYLRKEG